ncbi:MAG: hypothetical protein B7X00_00590 [Legionella sp. 21-45-4]|nr:MAG: hypothetical protein B7X00_00590 [Legionella sp. 21-45-4]
MMHLDLSMHAVTPFIGWVKAHPFASLGLTFIISFAESLAVIGSLVPGSVMMTLVGMLAGAGAMRIDLTLICATLGAIAGDGGSYLIGFTFSERLNSMWPFKRYPKWLNYGEDYFKRHGGKSIFLGRFIGPLRSIIPVIAGMMRMNTRQFFISNSLSAIAWSIVYVGPGILIGTASADYAKDNTAEIILFTFSLLSLIWLISLIIRLIFSRKHHK